MINIFGNTWVVGIGAAIIAGLILYYFFGIGKEKKSVGAAKSQLVSVGRDINVGRDVFVGVKPSRKRAASYINLYNKKRTLLVTDAEPKNLSLHFNFIKFKKISSKITLKNNENVKWRAGFTIIKETYPKRDYVFHVYQEPGNNSFHSRIVEIEPGIREISPDIHKYQLAVEDTRNFEMVIENKDGEIFFYVDGIPLGQYTVPLKEISDINIRGWSHGNTFPITIIVDNVRVWY